MSEIVKLHKNYVPSFDPIKNKILVQIDQALKDVFGDHTNELKEVLDGTIIPGSFILGAILGEQYKDGDIDFYTSLSDFYTSLPDIKNHNFGRPCTSLEKFFDKYGKFDAYYAAGTYGDVLGNQIRWIRSYIINGKRVQSIHVNMPIQDIPNFIYNNFDFDICKSIYTVINGNANIDIFNMDAIFNKSCDFNFHTRLGYSVKRYHKYTRRGFNINRGNLDDLYERIKNTVHDEIDIVELDWVEEKDNYLVYKYAIKYKSMLQNVWNYCQTIKINGDDVRLIKFEGENKIKYYTQSFLQKDMHRTVNCGRENCPMELCEKMHVHIKGRHIGHGSCVDLILVEK